MILRVGHGEPKRATTDGSVARVSEFVMQLAEAVAHRNARFKQFEHAESLLAASIPADVNAGMKRRLHNAWRYHEGGESGAARYELKLLVRFLISHSSSLTDGE